MIRGTVGTFLLVVLGLISIMYVFIPPGAGVPHRVVIGCDISFVLLAIFCWFLAWITWKEW
jgi:hypothetical protein